MSLSNGELLLASQIRTLALEIRAAALTVAWDEEQFLSGVVQFRSTDAAGFLKEALADELRRLGMTTPEERISRNTFVSDWEANHTLDEFIPTALQELADVARQIRRKCRVLSSSDLT